MEFYASLVQNIDELKGFNSQRDGILHKEGFKSDEISLFQFPTGWNSTEAKAK